MELIRISCDKIKISLSKAELDEYDLTVDEIDGSAPKTKRAFRELFVSARDQTGFDAEGQKVFVQIFRARGGGCEIFVSKVIKKSDSEPKNDEAYRFSDLSALTCACKSLINIEARCESDAYAGENGYVLCLHKPNEIEKAVALEWGNVTEAPMTEYIGERYRVIRLRDAVQTLSVF